MQCVSVIRIIVMEETNHLNYISLCLAQAVTHLHRDFPKTFAKF